jgi:hypothetical protein
VPLVGSVFFPKGMSTKQIFASDLDVSDISNSLESSKNECTSGTRTCPLANEIRPVWVADSLSVMRRPTKSVDWVHS